MLHILLDIPYVSDWATGLVLRDRLVGIHPHRYPPVRIQNLGHWDCVPHHPQPASSFIVFVSPCIISHHPNLRSRHNTMRFHAYLFILPLPERTFHSSIIATCSHVILLCFPLSSSLFFSCDYFLLGIF